jgi:pimeloyl-ACP methyl ester carboxylesterase
LLTHLGGYRVHAVDLPGHGLSDPVRYRRGAVRSHTLDLVDDIYDALGLDTAPVVCHSLGGMFALWYDAARPGRISSLVAFGCPAVALPGVRVRFPLSPMTLPVVGPAMLRSPSTRATYRWLFGIGNAGAAASAAPAELLDALRFAGRRSSNARTVGALMRAINGFRQPRPESAMTKAELGRVVTPTLFVWGTDDPYLHARDAAPWIAEMPTATLHEMAAGHAPFLDEPAASARTTTAHLTAAGFPPSTGGPSRADLRGTV